MSKSVFLDNLFALSAFAAARTSTDENDGLLRQVGWLVKMLDLLIGFEWDSHLTFIHFVKDVDVEGIIAGSGANIHLTIFV